MRKIQIFYIPTNVPDNTTIIELEKELTRLRNEGYTLFWGGAMSVFSVLVLEKIDPVPLTAQEITSHVVTTIPPVITPTIPSEPPKQEHKPDHPITPANPEHANPHANAGDVDHADPNPPGKAKGHDKHE